MKSNLRNIIRNVLVEHATYEDVMSILSGKDSTIETIGIMTAWNPKSTEISSKENQSRQNRLKKDLRRSGYDFLDISGMFGSPEDSILILNIPKQHLIHLGSPEKYNQTSVIFGKRVGRKMVFDYLEDGVSFQKMDVVLGKDDKMVKDLTDIFSTIKEKRFKVPFFTPGFEYPEEKYKKDVLRSKNINVGDLETKYIKIVDMMLNKNLSPLKYEKFKKIVDLFFDEKGSKFVEEEYNKLSDMGMSGENLALMFGEYKFF